MSARRRVVLAAYTFAGVLIAAGSATSQQNAQGPHAASPVLITSPLQTSGQPTHKPSRDSKEKPLRHPHGAARSGNIADPVVQSFAPTPAAAQSLAQWEGLGVGLP